MARDQLAESINAAMELRKGGKTVRADGEHAAEKDDAKPTGDTGLFVKKAVEAVAVTDIACALQLTINGGPAKSVCARCCC